MTSVIITESRRRLKWNLDGDYNGIRSECITLYCQRLYDEINGVSPETIKESRQRI